MVGVNQEGLASIDVLKSLEKDFLMAETLSDFEKLKSETGQCMRSQMELTVTYVQALVCKRLKEFDDQPFKIDRWQRKEGGGGITCLLQDGKEVGLWAWGV